MDVKTQKMFTDIIVNANKRTVSPYSTTAKVNSVNGNTIYIEIPGSDRITPVKSSSVSVKKGDIVDLVVSHDDTHITGNRSDVAVSQTTVKQISQALAATRLEVDNTLDLFNNTIKMVNNEINMQDNKIEMQNNTITQLNNVIDQQNNTIEQYNNTIIEIGNTVNSQGNKITEIGNTVNSQGNKITEIGNEITEIGNTVNSQENKITEIGNTVNSQGNTITELGNDITSIGNDITSIGNAVDSQGNIITELSNTIVSQGNTISQINSTLDLQGTNIETLNSSMEIVNSAFVIQNGKLTGISEIITNILDAGYVTTDLLNAEVAWIENGKIKQGAIGAVEIADSSITTAKIAELSADVITTGTLKTECLILTTDEVNPETGEKKVALITALNAKVNAGEGNILDGAVIADETIEAAKITVVDLNAFGATIGNFNISTSSMYNGKTSLKDPTNGVYIGTDGIALGQGSLLDMTDDSPFRIESDGDFHLGAKDNNYVNFDAFTGELDINAKTIKMGSKTVSEIAQDTVDSLQIGGRNLIINSSRYRENSPFTNTSAERDGTIFIPTDVYMPCVPGETYTFQCKTDGIWGWHDTNGTGGGKTHIFLYLQTANEVGTAGFASVGDLYSNEYQDKTGRGVWTYTIPTDKEYVRIVFRVDIHSDGSTPYTVNWWDLKAELGSKATDWTPAPEDVETSVDTKLENYATLEVTNNKISTAVTETKTYADGTAFDAVSTAKSYTDQTAESITATVEGINGRMTKIEQDAEGFTWTIDETAIVTSVNEYYKSTSPTSLSGGSWSTSQPTWSEGTYIWMRTKNTNGKGIFSYTTPACITGNTGATGRDGADALSISITSSNGTIFKNRTGSTVLTAHVFKGSVEQTVNTNGTVSGIGTVKWYLGSTLVSTSKTLTVNASSVTNTATYTVNLE